MKCKSDTDSISYHLPILTYFYGLYAIYMQFLSFWMLEEFQRKLHRHWTLIKMRNTWMYICTKWLIFPLAFWLQWNLFWTAAAVAVEEKKIIVAVEVEVESVVTVRSSDRSSLHNIIGSAPKTKKKKEKWGITVKKKIFR